MRNIVIPVVLFIITGISFDIFAAENNKLHVHDPWIREAPPNAKMLAAYMKLENHDNKKHIITHVTSEDFDKIEIHTSISRDDVMVMEKRKRLVVHAGKSFYLQPGDYHLMLIGPKRALKHGDKVTLSFHLKGEETIIEQAKVKRVLGSVGKKHTTKKKSHENDQHNH